MEDIVAKLSASRRVEWALENLPGEHVLTSSFGAQAAVMLHLVTRLYATIPVIVADTGYLFPETYRFIDELTERLELNIQVYRAPLSPAWQEARYGQRWAQGVEGLDAYNEDNKVAPVRYALGELGAGTWFAGLRRCQSRSRSTIPFLQKHGDRSKVLPIADWSDQDVHEYLKRHELPYHPLWNRGYISIGDMHSTRPIHEVSEAAATRFFGLRGECGIHLLDMAKV